MMMRRRQLPTLRHERTDSFVFDDSFGRRSPNMMMAHARPVYLKERAHVYMTGGNSNSSNNKRSSSGSVDRENLPRPPNKSGSSPAPVTPPERPPKKPHLRSGSCSSCSNSSSPTPTALSATPTPTSRGATPTRSFSQRRHSKPKFPSPPSSPRRERRAVTPPSTPPTAAATPIQMRELPPPPTEEVARSSPSAQTTLRICDKDSPLRIGNNNGESIVDGGSEGKYRRMRATTPPPPLPPPHSNSSSPANKVCLDSNVRPSAVSNGDIKEEAPARPPKRESPATIAAKGAPGWEKFLGGQTSTVQFTSEEVDKIRSQREEQLRIKRQQQQHQQQQQLVTSSNPPPRPPPKPKSRPPMPQPLETNLDEDDLEEVLNNLDEASPSPPAPSPRPNRVSSPATNKNNSNIGLNPIHSSKSSPSLQQQQQSNPSPLGKKPKSWKNSLDNLKQQQQQPSTELHQNGHGSPVRGFVNNPLASLQRSNKDLWKHGENGGSHHHAHSNSDSGLSSLSGRASTMSPISTMSTVSSVSSASSNASSHHSNHSSGSSSRASLRSASIVSSCTIPLDEEDEEAAVNSPECSPSGTMVQNRNKSFKSCDGGCDYSCPPPAIKKLPEESECEVLGRELLEVWRATDSFDQKLIALFDVPPNARTSSDYLSGLFGEPCSQMREDNDAAVSSCNNTDDGISCNSGSRRSSTSTIKGRMEEDIKALNGISTSSSSKSFENARRKFSEGNKNSNNNSGIDNNSSELVLKKETLLNVVTRKVEALKSERDRMKEASKLNEERGRQLWRSLGSSGATPQECDKYKASVEEADKIASLLSGLAARRAKAENAVMMTSAGQEDKDNLLAKRDKLSEQLSEARRLKENIDRRSEVVARTLGRYLGHREESEHRRFLATKVRIIVDSRELQDKLQTAEEQLDMLKQQLR